MLGICGYGSQLQLGQCVFKEVSSYIKMGNKVNVAGMVPVLYIALILKSTAPFGNNVFL